MAVKVWLVCMPIAVLIYRSDLEWTLHTLRDANWIVLILHLCVSLFLLVYLIEWLELYNVSQGLCGKDAKRLMCFIVTDAT